MTVNISCCICKILRSLSDIGVKPYKGVEDITSKCYPFDGFKCVRHVRANLNKCKYISTADANRAVELLSAVCIRVVRSMLIMIGENPFDVLNCYLLLRYPAPRKVV